MTIHPSTRRALSPLAALLLAACGSGSPTTSAGGSARPASREPEPNELLVLEWAGYEAEDFWVDFATANPDTDVEFEFGANDADILALMQAGSEADIFHFYTGWQQFYVDEGLVQEIDTSKLTNWDKVPDEHEGAGPDRRQAVLPPVGLGIHLDPVQHRARPRGHQLGRPVQRGVRRPHLDVGRRAGAR